MNKKALIIGHTGQDGFYLTQLLLSKQYDVFGISSTSTFASNGDTISLDNLLSVDYTDAVISKIQPDELYYLAAVHQSSVEQSFDDLAFYKLTLDVNSNAYLNLLNSVLRHSLKTKVFYAASSHIFGGTETKIQNENTPICPISIYGVSKVLGMNLTELYRQKGLDASVGILYNHESPKRHSKFVSKKIVETAVKIKFEEASELVLGDLNANIDWGYAPDYMLAAHLIVNSNAPGNYIISSGKLHTVRDFVEIVFRQLGLDWTNYVNENKSIILKRSVTILQGDNTKLRNITNWKPSVDLEGMIKILVEAEIEKRSKH